jgi:hypothetical protein
VRTIPYVPLVTTPQGHYNQPATALVWAETAGGLRGGYVYKRGESTILVGGGVGNSGHFGPVRTIPYVPLVTTPQGHYNQPATALVSAETGGGLRGGYVYKRGDSMILCHLEECQEKLFKNTHA